ncbi:MAG TPA: TMEM175 family protein [Gemmatimonadales bacterium]|nr:TMEM175 family protein [Gemmatimonadales bacterium]
MSKGRMEAFSDGVIAIIITIMVLELRPPEGADLGALRALLPVLGSYVLSFVYLGIYWNNHHHLLQAATQVSGGVLWANLHLLFWLTLVPFVTAWMGATHFAAGPVAAYGTVLICAGCAYYLLVRLLLVRHGKDSALARAIGRDVKGRISILIYGAGIALAFVAPWAAFGLYMLVALIWLIPDRRIERELVAGGK